MSSNAPQTTLSGVNKEIADAVERAVTPLYDPEAGLIRLSYAGNIHSQHLDKAPKHPTRDSLAYAFVLLASGKEANRQRAQTIVTRVLDLQEISDPQDRRYGLWPYFAEEPVAQWPNPDFNWADFMGMSLLQFWHVVGTLLDPALGHRVREAIGRAALCVQRRNVHLTYTNIAMKGTFVTLAAAELLEDESLRTYALTRMRALHATVFAADGVAEYNSPAYAPLCLGAMMSIDRFVRDPEARELARAIQHRLWLHLARHFHAPTGELAGPHSRAYSITMHRTPGTLGALFERVSGGAVRFPPPDPDAAPSEHLFAPFHASLLEPDVPAEALAFFHDRERRDEVSEKVQTFHPGRFLTIRTSIQPAFCLGSVSGQNGFWQRHNLIGYWPGPNGPGHLRQYYLHDERPCVSGFFASAQRGGTVLAANLIEDGADEHVSPRVPGMNVRFLGAVFELDTAGESLTVTCGDESLAAGKEIEFAEGQTLFVRLSRVWVALKLLRHRSLTGSPAVACCENGVLRVMFPQYRGPARDLQWTDFAAIHTFYGLVMTEPQPEWELWRSELEATVAVFAGEGAVNVAQWNGLRLAVPNDVRSEEAMRTFTSESNP